MIHGTSKQRKPKIQGIEVISLLRCAISQYIFKPLVLSKLCQSTTVSSQC